MAICNNKKCSLGECDQAESCAAYIPVATNADRIRAMSDEELASVMYSLQDPDDRIPFCRNLPDCEILLEAEDGVPQWMCINCLLHWLKQPAVKPI